MSVRHQPLLPMLAAALIEVSTMTGSARAENADTVAGFELWVADPLVKLLKDAQRPSDAPPEIRIRAVRNEYESGQLALRATQDLRQVRCSVSPLKAEEGGGVIGGDDLHVNFLGYVPVTKNTQGVPEDELLAKAPVDIPDPLLEDETIEVAAGSLQPIWLTVHVPNGAEPGRYRGAVRVSAGDASAEAPVVVEVLPITLPDERHLAMTNWLNYGRLAQQYGLEPWSEEHWQMIERYVENLAEHRQNVVLVSLGLIKIYQEADGSLTFDYADFDRFIELFEKHGVADRIEGSHLGGRGEGGWSAKEMVFHDLNVTPREGVEPKEISRDDKVRALMADLQRHLKEKGWLGRYMQHIADEPIPVNLASWEEKSAIVHAAAPKIKRIDAIHVPDLHGQLEVYCPQLDYFDKWYDHFQQLVRDEGIELWFYTCCNPRGRYANRFTDFALTKTRILHWMNYLYDAPGYLHWGGNHWTEDPYHDVISGSLPPGDSFIIYPGKAGPADSIRWEALRDGAEDYELLWLLAHETRRVAKTLRVSAKRVSADAQGKEICRRIIRTLTDYDESAEALRGARDAVLDAILELRREPLLLAWTDPPSGEPFAASRVKVRGAAQRGSRVTVNGKSVKMASSGTFSAAMSVSPGARAVDIVARRGGEEKRLRIELLVVEQAVLDLQRAVRNAAEVGVDTGGAEGALLDHLALLKRGEAPAALAESERALREACDKLHMRELNARLDELRSAERAPDAELDALLAKAQEMKRLKDYVGARELLLRAAEMAGKSRGA